MIANIKKHQIFFIGVLLTAFVSQGTQGQQQMSFVTDEPTQSLRPPAPKATPSWDYSKQGKDWGETIDTCNTTTFEEQSPMVMNVSLGEDYTDWRKYKFSFIPNFQKTQIDQISTDLYVVNMTLKPLAPSALQGFYAVEPKRGLYKYVRWETTNVQFHYPAEHKWTAVVKNGTNATVQAVMELQVYGYDALGIGTTCKKSMTSGLSLFFFLEEQGSEATNKFFEFTEKGQDFDLSLLVDVSTPMQYPIYGYVGSLTQPPCTRSVCWYLVQRAFPITQKQLDYFKVKGVDANARDADIGSGFGPFYNPSIFGKNNEIIDPSM